MPNLWRHSGGGGVACVRRNDHNELADISPYHLGLRLRMLKSRISPYRGGPALPNDVVDDGLCPLPCAPIDADTVADIDADTNGDFRCRRSILTMIELGPLSEQEVERLTCRFLEVIQVIVQGGNRNTQE